jgi:small subunit ribosomal protein S4
VNGKKVSIPSYLTKPGEVITVKENTRSRALVKLHLQSNPPPVPDFLERSTDDPPTGKVVRMPERDDVDPHIRDINELLIIESAAR